MWGTAGETGGTFCWRNRELPVRGQLPEKLGELPAGESGGTWERVECGELGRRELSVLGAGTCGESRGAWPGKVEGFDGDSRENCQRNTHGI